MENSRLKLNKELGIAIFFTTIFTLGLMNAIYILINISAQILSEYNPDPWPSHYEYIPTYNSIVETLTPIGNIAFILSIALIVVGFLMKRFKLSFLGSISLCLPIFADFAFTMFMFAGIGLTRILWISIIEVDPILLKLGDIILLPMYIVEFLSRDILFFFDNLFRDGSILPYEIVSLFYILEYIIIIIYGLTLVLCVYIGFGVSIFSIFTWFYGKMKGMEVIDFWIYKYSRHPQYFGFILTSYGVIAFFGHGGSGAYVPSPTIFWIIATLSLIAVAIHEENNLKRKNQSSEEYWKWRDKTPFLFYLPKRISEGLLLPMQKVLSKKWPETDREIVTTILLYGAITVISTILMFIIMWYFTIKYVIILLLISIGFGILIFSIFTWFYGKIKGLELIDFWIYRYSRHPQYLGFIMSSYGLIALFGFRFQAGAYAPSPTLFWIIATLSLIAAAIREDNYLLKNQSVEYRNWRDKTPFLFYVPKKLSDTLLIPMRKVIAKEWPETDREIMITIFLYGTITVILSILMIIIIRIVALF